MEYFCFVISWKWSVVLLFVFRSPWFRRKMWNKAFTRGCALACTHRIQASINYFYLPENRLRLEQPFLVPDVSSSPAGLFKHAHFIRRTHSLLPIVKVASEVFWSGQHLHFGPFSEALYDPHFYLAAEWFVFMKWPLHERTF